MRVAGVLASLFGNRSSFTATSSGLPGVVRSFTRFTGAVAQVTYARVWVGFHFRFACQDANQIGRHVAHQVQTN